MRERIQLKTRRDQELVDITGQARAIVARSGIRDGLVQVYAQGATAANMIQVGRSCTRWSRSGRTGARGPGNPQRHQLRQIESPSWPSIRDHHQRPLAPPPEELPPPNELPPSNEPESDRGKRGNRLS